MATELPPIIGLTGLATAGKDTVADFLLSDPRIQKHAFADALRKEVASAFDVSMDHFTDPARKHTPIPELALRNAPGEFLDYLLSAYRENFVLELKLMASGALDLPRSPRQLMQWWGTEYRRVQDTNYWLFQLGSTLSIARRKGGMVCAVVTDCRFPNEAEFVRDHGGVVWQVVRLGLTHSNTPEGKHASVTTGLELNPERTLLNDGTLQQLRDRTLEALAALEVTA